MAADAGDDVGEPGFGLDAVEARGAREREVGGSPLAARVRPADRSERAWLATVQAPLEWLTRPTAAPSQEFSE